jgi:hypothetical protein
MERFIEELSKSDLGIGISQIKEDISLSVSKIGTNFTGKSKTKPK